LPFSLRVHIGDAGRHTGHAVAVVGARNVSLHAATASSGDTATRYPALSLVFTGGRDMIRPGGHDSLR